MRNRLTAVLLLVSSCLPVLAELPQGVVDTQPNGDTPLSPEASLAKITVPDGFKVTLFAGEPDVYQPIAMEFDDRGRLWVVENFSYPDWQSKDQDRILIFEDKDNDGHFDSRTVFADNLSNITGIALGYGGVWCASTPYLIFIPDRDGDDKPDGSEIAKLDGWNDKSKDIEHNVFNGMTWGMDGWLYGSHGILADSHVGTTGTAKFNRQKLNCGIWRYHPVSEQFEVVAHGTTNPWGIDFNEVGEGFFTNCVIGHLWHLIPGARYERMYGKHFNQFTYTQIGACSDHLHWGGGSWTESRGGEGVHSIAGGGHAHVGTMIYLGGTWPEKYHGSLFTCNLHGNRINRDVFERSGSGYVAKHAPDFLMANDPWFRGISIKYGPDGNVFVSDWTDLGECHDKDGTHRSSGRIYKISYVGDGDKTIKFKQRDLSQLSSKELLALLLKHPNAWQRRHALRILQERDNTEPDDLPIDFDMPGTQSAAMEIAMDVTRPKLERLRALWATNGKTKGLEGLLNDADPHMQAWYIRLGLFAQSESTLRKQIPELIRLARTAEPNVKLEIASRLGPAGLETADRWDLARAMIDGLPDDDPNLTQMVWYAIEPLHDDSRNVFVSLALPDATEGPNPNVSKARLKIIEFIVRKTMSAKPMIWKATEPIFANALATKNADIRLALMQGLARAVTDKIAERPKRWLELHEKLLADGENNPLARDVALELSVKFRERSVVSELRNRAADGNVSFGERQRAIRLLTENLGIKGSGLTLSRIGREEPRLLPTVFRAHGKSAEPDADRFLKESVVSLKSLVEPNVDSEIRELAPSIRDALVGALIANPQRVGWLLDAIESKKVPSSAILPMHAMQIERLEDKQLNARLRKVWGVARKSSKEKLAKIHEWKQVLTDVLLAKADLKNGRKLFHENCGKCHTLFGRGEKIGPDLTGSDRRNVDYVLQNVIDPSAAVGKDYRLKTLLLESGLSATGVVVEESPASVTLQKVDSRETFARDEILKTKATRLSLMPEGQFDRMKPSDVRDIVGYLRLDEDLK